MKSLSNCVLVLFFTALFNCSTPIPRLSKDRPPTYRVIGQPVEAVRCFWTPSCLVGGECKWLELSYYYKGGLGETLRGALERTDPPADGLIDVEITLLRVAFSNEECVRIRGTPVLIGSGAGQK